MNKHHLEIYSVQRITPPNFEEFEPHNFIIKEEYEKYKFNDITCFDIEQDTVIYSIKGSYVKEVIRYT